MIYSHFLCILFVHLHKTPVLDLKFCDESLGPLGSSEQLPYWEVL